MEVPGGWELIAILVVIMLVFGYKKLPDATRSIGRSMRIFKAEVKGLKSDDEVAPPPPARTTVAEVAPTLPAAPVPPAPAVQVPAPHVSAPKTATPQRQP